MNEVELTIAVVGCGAMGSVYAGRLSRAGHRVTVVDAWAEHIAAIATAGLRISGPDGEYSADVAAVSLPPNEAVDLVVLAVKAADAASAARSLNGLVGDQTVVLTIQNGLGSADHVAEYVDPDRLAVGIAKGFGASLVGPGHAHHNAMRALRFGSYRDLPRDRVERVAGAWRQAGFDCAVAGDIIAMQWEKLICNAAYSAPCALTGMTVGEVMDHPEMGPLSVAAATEAWEIAIASGISVDVSDPVAHVRDFGARMPDAKPSALLDLEAGRVSEVGFINGAVPVAARRLGLTAPVNATLTALVRTRELSAPAASPR